MMQDYQHRSFPWLEFIMVIAGIVLTFMIMGGGGEGGSTTNSNNTSEVHVLSDNEINLFSPTTIINYNSGNTSTAVTGDRNAINMNPPCYAWQGVEGDPYNPRLCVSWQDDALGSPRPQP